MSKNGLEFFHSGTRSKDHEVSGVKWSKSIHWGCCFISFIDYASLWHTESQKRDLRKSTSSPETVSARSASFLKITFFEVNISRLTSLDSLSILLWPPGYADLRFIIAKRKIRGLLKASEGLNTCREYWEIFSLITCSFSGFSRPTETQPVCLSIFVHLVRQLDSQPANIWIGLIDNLSFSQSVHSRPFICRSDLESSNMSSFSSFDKDHLANICKFQRLLGAMRC